jgi:hypothetical protein
MRDEALEFINRFAKSEQRNIEDAQRAYQIVVTRKRDVDGAVSLSHLAFGAFVHGVMEKDLWRGVNNTEEWWTFGTFCQENLGMSLARAHALRKLWEGAQWLSLTDEEVQRLGWVLSLEIVKSCKSREEVEVYIAMFDDGAKKGEIVDAIRAASKIPSKRHTSSVKVRVSAPQRTFLDETLEIAAKSVNKQLGVNIDATECLMVVLAQWREAHGNGGITSDPYFGRAEARPHPGEISENVEDGSGESL